MGCMLQHHISDVDYERVLPLTEPGLSTYADTVLLLPEKIKQEMILVLIMRKVT